MDILWTYFLLLWNSQQYQRCMVHASSAIKRFSVKKVTFCQYHKTNVDKLKEDLAASAFVVCPLTHSMNNMYLVCPRSLPYYPLPIKNHWLIGLVHFFINKINKIRNTFRYCTSKRVPLEKKPSSFSSFQLVSESEVLRFRKESSSKTCSLDPWSTFLVNKCIDILLLSISKPVNLSP